MCPRINDQSPRFGSTPQPVVELALDDPRTARFEDNSEILPPLRMRQPPFPKLHLAVINLDAPVHVERAEISGAQVDRHPIRIAPAVEVVLHLLEEQHPCPTAIKHHAVVAVKLGEQGCVIRTTRNGFAAGSASSRALRARRMRSSSSSTGSGRVISVAPPLPARRLHFIDRFMQWQFARLPAARGPRRER
jgi:hypothetical protein